MRGWSSMRAAVRVGVIFAVGMASSGCASARGEGGRGAHDRPERELGETIVFHDVERGVGFRWHEVSTAVTSMDVRVHPRGGKAQKVHVDLSKRFVAEHEIVDMRGTAVARVDVEEAFTLKSVKGTSTREESPIAGRTYLIGDGPRGAIVVHDDLSTITAPELAALAEEIPALKEHGAPARGPSKRSGPASAGVARAAKLSDAPVRVGERSPTYEAMLIEGIGAVEEIEDIDSYLDRKKSVRGEPCAIFAHDVTYRSVSAEGMEMHMHSRGEEAIRLVDSKVADSTSNAEIEFEKPATDDESAPTTGTGTVRVAQTIDYR